MEERKIHWTNFSSSETWWLLDSIEITFIQVVDLNAKYWMRPFFEEYPDCLIFKQESQCGSFYLYGKNPKFLKFIDKFFQRYQIRAAGIGYIKDCWLHSSFSAFIGRFFTRIVREQLVELVSSELLVPREKPHGLGDVCWENYYIMREVPQTLPVQYPFPVIFI